MSHDARGADVAGLIAHATLCWRCIAVKTGLEPVELDDVLREVRRTVAVRQTLGPCDGCGRDTLCYRLAVTVP